MKRATMGRMGLAMGALVFSASSMAACGVVDIAEVDRMMPKWAPWAEMTAGPAACQFSSQQSEGMAILSVTLDFQASPKAAQEQVAAVRGATPKEMRTAPLKLPSTKAEGFTYAQPAGASSSSSNVLWWFTPVGSVVLSGMMLPPGQHTMSDAEQKELFSLLDVVAQKHAGSTAAKAPACPYFDDALVAKMLTGKAVKVQAFTENDCLAYDESGKVLQLMRLEEESAKGLRGGYAKVVLESRLGADGVLLREAEDGNPRSEAIYTKGAHSYRFILVPGENKAPTAQQEKLLVDLAAAAFQK